MRVGQFRSISVRSDRSDLMSTGPGRGHYAGAITDAGFSYSPTSQAGRHPHPDRQSHLSRDRDHRSNVSVFHSPCGVRMARSRRKRARAEAHGPYGSITWWSVARIVGVLTQVDEVVEMFRSAYGEIRSAIVV